jgi:putative ABC transport system permease protein
MATVVLIRGGLGVLDIGLVTVRQRIRETGVRRSFGATSGRIFAAVLLESVCAAAVEGMIAATAVGALAGLLPAIIAVRAKVIDAIRS